MAAIEHTRIRVRRLYAYVLFTNPTSNSLPTGGFATQAMQYYIPLGDRAPVHHHVRRGDSQCTTNKILPSSTGVVKLILQPRHPGRADRGQRRRRDAIHYPPSASGPPARTIRPRIAIFDHDCPLLVASGVGVAPPIGCQGQILRGAVREDTHSLSSESSSYGCS